MSLQSGSIVILINKRDSEMKVVLDRGNLNKYLQRTHCQKPTVDEVSSKFQGVISFQLLMQVVPFGC